jgi:tight adherence protein B
MMESVMYWLIPALFAASVAGLAYVILAAFMAVPASGDDSYADRTARQFEDLFLFISARRITESGWAASALAFIALFLITGGFDSITSFSMGLGIGIIGAAFAFKAPSQILLILKQRRLIRFNMQLADTLVSMSNALKAGFSITQAFESVAREGENPIAQEFSMFLQEIRVGVNFADALGNLEQRVGSEDLTLVVQAIEATRKTGGNLTEIFEKIASTIRERTRIENRIRTLTAQQRLQGIVVGAMPAVIGLAMTMIDPAMMLPFLHSRGGVIIILIDILLIACGALMIRKIIRIDV